METIHETMSEIMSESVEENDISLSLGLHLTKKKKKNKNRFIDTDTENKLQSGSSSSEMNTMSENKADYTYKFLLDRVLKLLKTENPDLNGCPTRTSLQPPRVLREGTKKTVFANFIEFCNLIHRDPNHVMAFILEELSIAGSLDGTQRLIIRGRFSPSAIESVSRKYVRDYVLCKACKGIDTLLTKDKLSRLTFLSCNRCRASQTVQ